MPGLDTKQAAKLSKLLETLHDLREKEDALLSEIDDLLGGGVGIGERMARARVAFCSAWATRYGGEYVWNFSKDNPQLKRLLLLLGVDEVTTRIGRYMAKSDDYFTRNRHSFGVFVATVNQHVEPAVAAARRQDGDYSLESEFERTQRQQAGLK